MSSAQGSPARGRWDVAADYDGLRRAFSWQIPATMNMGILCADRHPRDAVALIDVQGLGGRREYSFGQVADDSNRLANALRQALRVGRGDRIGIVLPQGIEAALSHLATYKLGAVALPLSRLFGPDALRHRLGDSGARVVVTDVDHVEAVAAIAGELGISVICTGSSPVGFDSFTDLLDRGSPGFAPVAVGPDDPALLIYTSGTTGAAKGALHGHRVLLGHLPGFDLSHEFFGREDDRFWTPADWAWIGGLMDALMPAWYHGRTVVATGDARFDPEHALRIIESEQVRNVFFPPTVLKLLRHTDVDGSRTRLRTIGSGGEPLPQEVLAWTHEHLGVTVNEFYGQTEANLLVGNCAFRWPVRPGSMGRAYPGHDVQILGEQHEPLPAGEIGQVALRMPDPVAFLHYWQQPERTREKLSADGAWLLTLDLARRDDDGYFWYVSREDDVINSAGYRIGPGEIEACLISHPAVAMAAAVGIPDPVRGEVVKAYVVVAPGCQPSAHLAEEIKDTVRSRLAAYLYPREIEFVAELPLTTTGKVRRAALRDRGAATARRIPPPALDPSDPTDYIAMEVCSRLQCQIPEEQTDDRRLPAVRASAAGS